MLDRLFVGGTISAFETVNVELRAAAEPEEEDDLVVLTPGVKRPWPAPICPCFRPVDL